MMFWRLLWRLLRTGRGRLGVALAGLMSGAAVTTALVNIQLDAERKLTQEFRALGANVVVVPPRDGWGETAAAALLEPGVVEQAVTARSSSVVALTPVLYVVALAGNGQRVIVAGAWMDELRRMSAWWNVEGNWIDRRSDADACLVGRNAARQLGVKPGGELELRYGDHAARLRVAGVADTGGAENNQVLVNLEVAQRLAGLEGRAALVQMSVAGTAEEVMRAVGQLAASIRGAQVRPVRQIAEAEGRLLEKIRGLILATVTLILALTALGVLATMAALAVERRRDVGLMKALGGSMAFIVRLFLTEVAVLGLVGGAAGSLAGFVVARWIGQRIFLAEVATRWEVFPLTLAVMVGVALAGAFPLRLLGHVRPAVILRGE